jgi:hypothetical protein
MAREQDMKQTRKKHLQLADLTVQKINLRRAGRVPAPPPSKTLAASSSSCFFQA